ncbi:hypothetical protein GCM10027182_09870 [Aquaspirillum soli]
MNGYGSEIIQSLKSMLIGRRAIVPLLAVMLLIPLSFFSFLLFHTVAELVSIVVATSAFIVAWNTYGFSRNPFLLFLGTGLLWLGALDLFHTLVYKGMNIYPGVTDANLPTQVWVATRYLQALLLLAVPWFGGRTLHRGWLITTMGGIALAVWAWIMSGYFPDAFIEGKGLTPFKIVSEYIIVLLLILAGLHLYWRRKCFDPHMVALISVSIVATIIAELAFTFYVDVYGLSNLIGHLFKILGYWYIYVALVEYALAGPFRLMAHAATTYDAIPDPTVVIDVNGEIRQTNAAARKLFNLSEAECVGRHCHDVLHASHLSIQDCPVCQQIYQGGTGHRIEVEDRLGQRWFEVILSPVTWGEQAMGMVHVSRDITQQKQMMTQLARSNAELQRFAEVTAHHLQEPARRLASYADHLTSLLGNRVEDDPEVAFSLNFIRQQARRQQNLLRDVERYLAADQPRGQMVEVDVNRLLTVLLQRLTPALQQYHAEVEVHPALPAVWIDTPRLNQIFETILENALRHAQPSHQEKTPPILPLHIVIHGERHVNSVRYTVCDNGVGIEATYRERVFRVFERLQSNALGERDGGGTGIGLAIVRRIVESCGGKVWIEDSYYGGCCVVFEIPIPLGQYHQ